MGYTIEGSDLHGFRVIDDKAGPLTGRHSSEGAALAAAGIKAEPKARGRKPAEKSDDES